MLRPPPRSTRTDTLVPYTTLFRSRQEAIAGVDRVRAGASSGFEDEVGTQVGLRGAVAPQAYGGVCLLHERHLGVGVGVDDDGLDAEVAAGAQDRSEEHTSELQSLMRTSYAVFCLKKKKTSSH